MRKGWKTRIDERVYFEEKKEEREQRLALLNMVRSKMDHDYKMQLQNMRENHEIN